MIRNINQVYLQRTTSSLHIPLMRMTYLQTVTVLLILLFIVLQQFLKIQTSYLHQLLVTVLIVGELIASLLFSSIRQMVRKETTTGSQQGKHEISTIRTYLIALKHVKFLNILCNFLALIGQIKAIRSKGQIYTHFYWALVYLPLALLSLSLANTFLMIFQKILDIYNNFEMEPDEGEFQSVI